MGNRRNGDVGQLADWESALRTKVKVMRELGVVVADGITLGPEPLPKEVARKMKEDPLYAKRSHYANLLGRVLGDEELKNLPEVA